MKLFFINILLLVFASNLTHTSAVLSGFTELTSKSSQTTGLQQASYYLCGTHGNNPMLNEVFYYQWVQPVLNKKSHLILTQNGILNCSNKISNTELSSISKRLMHFFRFIYHQVNLPFRFFW